MPAPSEPGFFCGYGCALHKGVMVSTIISWIIWFFITCLFWPAMVYSNVVHDKPKNEDNVLGITDGAPAPGTVRVSTLRTNIRNLLRTYVLLLSVSGH